MTDELVQMIGDKHRNLRWKDNRMSYNLKVINQLDREALVKIILETFTNRGHPMYMNDSFNRAK